MNVYRSLFEAAGKFGPCALAIGNFDGVHAGHQALLRQTASYAAEHALAPAVLTFHPHPAAIVAPERTPEMLCTLEERIRLLLAGGADRVLVVPFTREIACLSPQEFAQECLVDALGARAVFVGEGFRFGHRQSGDREVLAQLGERCGFQAVFLPSVTVRGDVVSSSLIRAQVRSANVSRACRLLGRPFSLSGGIVSGQGIGSKQTVPTLNIRPVPGLVLPRGVFVTETIATDGRRWPSITNVGTRPTFAGGEITIETFLLRPLTGQPPAAIELQFRHYVRPERAFNTAADLKTQIMRDVRRANSYWRLLDILRP